MSAEPPPHKRGYFKRFRHSFLFHNRTVRMFLAVFFLLLGIAGMVVPLAPGIPFLLFGLYLINPIWYRKTFRKLKAKFKKPKPPPNV